MHEVARNRAAFHKSKPGKMELVNPLLSTPVRGFTGINNYIYLYTYIYIYIFLGPLAGWGPGRDPSRVGSGDPGRGETRAAGDPAGTRSFFRFLCLALCSAKPYYQNVRMGPVIILGFG